MTHSLCNKSAVSVTPVTSRLQQQNKQVANNEPPPSSPLLSPIDAAAYLGITERTLASWRSTKCSSLVYVKVGRLVKYRVEDLDAYICAHTVTQA